MLELIAYVTGKNVQTELIFSQLVDRLPDYMIRSRIMRLDGLP